MCTRQTEPFAPTALVASSSTAVTAQSTWGPAPEHAARTNKRRLKLWEIDNKYHCPIIGSCLHVKELRSIAKKLHCTFDGMHTDYDIHVSFISVADQKNPLSIATQKALDKKHASAVRRFSKAKDVDALTRLWQEAVAQGQFQGALWALMTHPRTEKALQRMVYEETHMLSHQVGASLVNDAHLLAETRNELAEMRHESQSEARRLRTALTEREHQLTSLKKRLGDAVGFETELTSAKARIEALESVALYAELKNRIRKLEKGLEERTRSEERAQRLAAKWRGDTLEKNAALVHATQELDEHKNSIEILERLLEQSTDSGCEDCGECASCPESTDCNLEGRRVLCIGGRHSLTCHYRSLVDRLNGELMHHDGGMEDNRQRLDALLASADVVICPASYVSHDAYQRAKRYCKRTRKPCVLMKNAGVVSFARALEQVA